jgi:tRNA 2-thiocytidine biosynthesis protein TtcA
LERVLLRKLRQTCQRYQLLSPGDRVAIAASGGKDSSALLLLLSRFRRALPFEIELRALHVDQGQPGYDNRAWVSWLEREGIPFDLITEDTYSVVTSKLESTQTYCSLCSRLRRGVLYTALERGGFGKLALGHHRDDALETFLMNLFFAGKLQAMPAKYTTNCGRFVVIRPLIEIAEESLAEYASLLEFPILPCNLCGSQPHLQRKQMKALLASLEAKHPHVREVMLNALCNVRPSHLLDEVVASVWSQRDADVRPDPSGDGGPRRMAARVTLSSHGRLPLIEE